MIVSRRRYDFDHAVSLLVSLGLTMPLPPKIRGRGTRVLSLIKTSYLMFLGEVLIKLIADWATNTIESKRHFHCLVAFQGSSVFCLEVAHGFDSFDDPYSRFNIPTRFKSFVITKWRGKMYLCIRPLKKLSDLIRLDHRHIFKISITVFNKFAIHRCSRTFQDLSNGEHLLFCDHLADIDPISIASNLFSAKSTQGARDAKFTFTE